MNRRQPSQKTSQELRALDHKTAKSVHSEIFFAILVPGARLPQMTLQEFKQDIHKIHSADVPTTISLSLSSSLINLFLTKKCNFFCEQVHIHTCTAQYMQVLVCILVSLFSVARADLSLFLTAVTSTITVGLHYFCHAANKVQWRNARPDTKVNNFILCLKCVSLQLCKAAHRHSCVGLKERLLINERERE